MSAIQLVAYFIIIWEVPKGSGKVGIINQDTMAGWLPYIGTNSYILIILFVAVITAGMFVYLKYSKHGYEISVGRGKPENGKLCWNQGCKGNCQNAASVRCNMRIHRLDDGVGNGSYNHNHPCRRKRLFRNYGFLAGSSLM